MIHLVLGTDRAKARTHLTRAVAKEKARVVRITDANSLADLNAALQGEGLFAERRVLVFENVCAESILCEGLLAALPALKESSQIAYIYEEKPLADLRKKLEKYVETVEKFDAPKGERDTSIFALANALRRGDKKALWVSYMREIGKGAAPEAIHGVLFWAAKDSLLKSGDGTAQEKGLVATLAELPHEARRRGEDLEYALERFVLSIK